MRKVIKDYLTKEYDNYVKDLEALTNIDSGNGDLEGTEKANKFVAEKCRRLVRKPSSAITNAVAI